MLVCCQSSPAKKVCQEKTQVVYLYYCVYRVYRVSNKGMLYVRIIALPNQKGGVGKTTSTINIGIGLAQFGRTVLLADLDPQAHLTYSLGIPAHELEATIYEVLRGQTTLEKVMLQQYGVTILPASLDLSGAEIELAAVPGREFSHSPELRGKGCHHSSKASGSENLEVEEPVACWDRSAFHCHPTLAGLLGPTLVGDQVV